MKVGDPVENFSLPDHEGRVVSLSDFTGKRVLLYFYPKDDTPGCTRQACELRESFHAYQEAEIEILGVSPDSATRHRTFREKYALPFTLLSDVDRALAERFGVVVEKNMYGKKVRGIQRSSFLIDERGILIGEFRNVKPDGHAEAMLAAVRKPGDHS